MCGIVGYIGGRRRPGGLLGGAGKMRKNGESRTEPGWCPEPGWYYQHSQDARQTEMYGG